MKKAWSNRWLSSVQPRKQRKYRYNAPLHVKQGFVSANLSPEVRKRFGKRSMQLRKGDEIKVMRGKFRGKTCTVERVDLNKSKIYVEEIKVKKADGSEVLLSLQPSNLMITKLKLDDKKRQAIINRSEKSKKPAGSEESEADKPKTPPKKAPSRNKPAETVKTKAVSKEGAKKKGKVKKQNPGDKGQKISKEATQQSR